MLAALGSSVAAYMAWRAYEATSKQLQIEQEPFLVLRDNIFLEEEKIAMQVKNIGRGSATFIRASFDLRDPQPLFESSQPHSINLASEEESQEWLINARNLKQSLSRQLGKKLTTNELTHTAFKDIFQSLPSNNFQFEMYLSTYISYPREERIFVAKLTMQFVKERPLPGNLGQSGYEKTYLLKVMETQRLK
jgi:hypothetical protein